LIRSDAVTSISPFVRGQLLRLLAVQSTLIWNPVKDVNPTKRLDNQQPYPFRAMLAGRCGDRNKRVDSIGIPALVMAGFEESEVAVCGGEYAGWGTDMGIVSDETLNDLYNSVDFLICPTALGGLELSPLEGMVCGALPILCYDMSTFADISFYPQYWGCYPSAMSMAYRLRSLVDNPVILNGEREYCLAQSDEILDRFGKVAVAKRIVELARKVMGGNGQ
jgi:hypothetical protein